MTPKKSVEKERRIQLIQATLDLLAEDELENITLERIAVRAGVSKGIVTYYFKSKYELLLSSFSGFLDHYNQNIMKAYRPEMKPLEIFDMMIEFIFSPELASSKYIPVDTDKIPPQEELPQTLKFKPGQASRLMFVFYSRAVLDENFRNIFLLNYEEYKKGIEETIKYGIERGEFKSVDLEIATLAIMSMMDGLIFYYLIGLSGLTSEKLEFICKQFIRRFLL